MRTTRNHPRGFTLFELVLVMVILCIAMAVAAPSLRGWSHGARLRDSADQFLAAARFAHTKAIADSRIYRLYFDSRAGTYWITVQDGQQFVNVGSDFGRVFEVSEGIRMQVTIGDPNPIATPGAPANMSANAEYIEFYPSGRSMPATARFSDDQASIDVTCRSPAEGFRIDRDATQQGV
jgi:prepilin-type N-terminal cleavage/methylation domain-containing protein